MNLQCLLPRRKIKHVRAFLWVSICLFVIVNGSGIALAHAKNLDDFIIVAQVPSSDNKDEKKTGNEIERLQKDLAKLGQDLSKAIAEGNKKASEAINAAIEKTKKKLKKAMESDKKDQEKDK